MGASLYVHIPFCAHLCPYCDFPKVIYQKAWALAYLPALFDEIKKRDPGSCSTIYLGGGTPSVLPNDLLDELLSFLDPYLEEGGEFSIEMNPETIDEEKVLCLTKHKINRLSLGIQSSHDRLLKILGRHHDFARVAEAIGLLRGHGYSNINGDLMYGLPGESIKDLEQDIEAFLSLDLDHLSAYSLILEEGTLFHNEGIVEADNDLQADMAELISKRLKEHGYRHYEVSNYAKEGKRCRHNLVYWRDFEYVGCWLGASGYHHGVRYANTKNLTAYLRGHYEGTIEDSSPQSEYEIYLLTHLRLDEGFDIDDARARVGESYAQRIEQGLPKLLKEGLLTKEGNRIRPSERGLMLLDRILLALF